MSAIIPIEPGQWVLAFHQPYGLYDGITMAERLKQYASRHWMEVARPDEEFLVIQVDQVKPKTYTVLGSGRYICTGGRLPRYNVVAALTTEAAGLALRDKLCSIGEEVGSRIEKEMHRRIQKFSEREQAKGLERVHRCLPQFFGGAQ